MNELFVNFFNDRWQYISWNEIKSTIQNLMEDVPQRLALNMFLFFFTYKLLG